MEFYELADIAAGKRLGKHAPPISPLAMEAVKRIDALFNIEREINGIPAWRRLAVRRERSAPLVAAFEEWMRAERATPRYRKPCADIETLRNPVSLWLAGGGRFHSKPRRQISSPSEILPRWRAGIEAEVDNAVIRDAFWFAMFTGLLREEVLTLNWEHVDSAAHTFHVRHTRGTLSPELPVTAQLAAILDRRQAECGSPLPRRRAWVFPSQTSASGHLRETKHLYARISETAGAKFWFQGLRNCYLALAERELLLPSSLTSRLLNRAPVGGIAAGHPEDWTIEQLREPAQRIANRIEELMNALAPQPALAHDPQ